MKNQTGHGARRGVSTTKTGSRSKSTGGGPLCRQRRRDIFPQTVPDKARGRIVTFGATRGPVPQLVMPFIFLKQLDILQVHHGQ